MNSHSKTINMKFQKDFELPDLKETLRKFPSIVVKDNAYSETDNLRKGAASNAVQILKKLL